MTHKAREIGQGGGAASSTVQEEDRITTADAETVDSSQSKRVHDRGDDRTNTSDTLCRTARDNSRLSPQQSHLGKPSCVHSTKSGRGHAVDVELQSPT